MRKTILSLITVLVFILGASAQDRTITGRVVNDKETPMEGVSVTASDGKAGTQTDKNGNYTIAVSVTTKAIVFSFVNYETVTKQIGKSATINVTMTSSDIKLEEVVVVGYGVQQKKAFTGSASKVDTKEFAQLITPSVDKQLAGRAAGVSVTNSSGLVNAPARIRIRGLQSVNVNQDPIVIIDGVVMTTGNLALTTNSNAIGDINPDDIESIDVLKDGSATSIYGSLGANGIIQITTKKGKRGKTQVNYTGVIGYSSPMQRFNLLNANEFVSVANEKLTNSGALAQARMDSAGTNTNWQDNVFVNNAFTTSQTVSVSGGNDKSSFYLSLNYADSRGIIRSNKNTSYRIRNNFDVQATKWLKIGNNLSVSRQNDFDQNNSTNGLSGAIVGAIRALPNVGIYSKTHATGYNLLPGGNALGQGANLRSIDDNYTNIAFVLDNNRYQSDKYRILENVYGEVSLLKGLKYTTKLGVDYFTDNSSQILDPRHGDGFGSNGVIYQGQQNILQTDIQNYLNYNFSARNHNFSLTAGHELIQKTSRYFTAQGTNISDLFYIKENIITSSASTQSITGYYQKEGIESFYGRLYYDYKSKYFVHVSLRRDGQSSLARDKRYETFPGVSIGWRPVQEGFWKRNSKLSKVVNDLKIKASYAKVGNPLSGFPYLSTYGAAPYGNINGIAVSGVGDPNLEWELSSKYDVGVEMSLFRNVNVTVDYFKNDIDGLILAVPTPYSTGIPGNIIFKNIGRVRNTGIELSLDFNLVRNKNFTWNINANYTNVKNKIISLYKLGGVDVNEYYPSNYNVNRVGEPINALFGYEFAGVNTGNGNPVYYNAAGQLVQRNIANGTYYFANSLNDPALGAQTTLTTADKKILGNAQPKYYGAFTNTFSYKGFDLEIMFRYGGGNKIMNITRQEVLLNQKFANGGKELLNRWTTPGQVTDVPKLWYAQDAVVNQNGEAISRFVEKGDFLRLQNVVLSYTVNAEKLQSSTNNTVKSLRFFVQAQNVHVWSKYKGIDPEAFSANGQDNNISPQVRNLSIGVSLGL